jgi:agmatine/peptidylarginine deiminase
VEEKRRLVAEWEEQDGVMLSWPEVEMDWGEDTEEVRACYRSIMEEVSRREKVILLRQEEWSLNDTWVRDYGLLSTRGGEDRVLVDYRFDGWGGKYESGGDDGVGGKVYKERKVFASGVGYVRREEVVTEGGNLETDGEGTLLSSWVCAGKRVPYEKREEWAREYKERLGIERVLWVESGELEGDDTDGHIDTLVRFGDARTLLYTRCKRSDSHYVELKRLEEELCSFRGRDGRPYKLEALPLPSPVVHKGKRLPASYANFLFINGGVLVPVYGVEEDAEALGVFRRLYPNRAVVGLDCRVLLRQGGSLHCATMQYPRGFLRDERKGGD